MFFRLLILLSFFFSASVSQATRFPPCLVGTPEQLAAQKYHPFGLMKVYSLVGLLTYTGLQKFKGEQEARKSEYKGVDTFAAIGAIVGIASSLGGPSRYCISETEVSRGEVDGELFREYRRSFYLTHGIVAVSQIGMAATSRADHRFEIAAIGIASPFILDLIMRPIFYRDSLSPWAAPAILPTIQTDGSSVLIPGIQFTAQF